MGGQTKSGLQPNNEKPKSATTTSHSSQQLGMKNVQSGRPTNYLGTSWTKGNTDDEFKHGFPSNGLSTSSYKWWGSKGADGHEVVYQSRVSVQENNKHKENIVDDDSSSRTGTVEAHETKDSNVCPEGATLLTEVRRRSAKEARQALKLGVCHGYVANNPSNKQKALLLKIFKSSLPTSWRSDF